MEDQQLQLLKLKGGTETLFQIHSSRPIQLSRWPSVTIFFFSRLLLTQIKRNKEDKTKDICDSGEDTGCFLGAQLHLDVAGFQLHYTQLVLFPSTLIDKRGQTSWNDWQRRAVWWLSYKLSIKLSPYNWVARQAARTHCSKGSLVSRWQEWSLPDALTMWRWLCVGKESWGTPNLARR